MRNHTAYLIIDVQRDFCPGGALAVPDGDAVIDPINRQLRLAEQLGAPVFLSADYHPATTPHFDTWPAHCVAGTEGVKFHDDLYVSDEAVIIRKGMGDSDGYSAFDGRRIGGQRLDYLLWARGITDLVIGGLATDYCVKATVLEACRLGYRVTVPLAWCRAVELAVGDSDRACSEMVAAGAVILPSRQVVVL